MQEATSNPRAPDGAALNEHRRRAAEAWQRGSEAAQRLALTMQQRVLATEASDDAKNLFLAHEMVAYEQRLRAATFDAQVAMHTALLEERFSYFAVSLAVDTGNTSNASAPKAPQEALPDRGTP